MLLTMQNQGRKPEARTQTCPPLSWVDPTQKNSNASIYPNQRILTTLVISLPTRIKRLTSHLAVGDNLLPRATG